MMLILGAAGLVFQYQSAPPLPISANGAHSVQMQRFISRGITIGPLVSAFYAGCMVLLLQTHFFRKLLAPLKRYGRMAFTNYILQTVFILLAGKVLEQVKPLTCLQSLLICIIIIMIQLLFSTFWLRYFKFGPLEWVWRALTYLELPPMRKRT
jgi:uncharacterized membrane protein YeiB